MEKLLTIQQIAERSQISEITLYKLARSGKIPAIKIGNQWRFKMADIDGWLERQKVVLLMGAGHSDSLLYRNVID